MAMWWNGNNTLILYIYNLTIKTIRKFNNFFFCKKLVNIKVLIIKK